MLLRLEKLRHSCESDAFMKLAATGQITPPWIHPYDLQCDFSAYRIKQEKSAAAAVPDASGDGADAPDDNDFFLSKILTKHVQMKSASERLSQDSPPDGSKEVKKAILSS